MKYYIGVDLGGTNVRTAIVDETGKLIHELKRPSYAQDGPDKVIENIVDMIKLLPRYQKCEGIGIGVPGPVDTRRGVMTMSTNLPGFTEYPFAAKMKEILGMPVYLDNDANVAGLAEAVVGSGKGQPIVYYITHSTGIGGALVVDGKIVSGRNGYAGEVGNIIVDRNRKKYNHLNAGAVENEASGLAVARIGKEILGERVESAKDVFELARQKDPEALKIIDKMAYDFALMMSVVGHICDPHVFVIGGGCSAADDVYFGLLNHYYNGLVHEGMKDVPIVKASLDEPGVVGAAMLARSYQL